MKSGGNNESKALQPGDLTQISRSSSIYLPVLDNCLLLLRATVNIYNNPAPLGWYCMCVDGSIQWYYEDDIELVSKSTH